ncbi:MAG: LicD family protein [Lachnospiraceae bacterium]|nr:LicD family protein [Lachnospiraceae bacterium]
MRKALVLSTEDLEKLHSINLEMISEVDRICRKNHIEYSLDGGTLLGAVRHKGFIPWDDDADLIFTRHEYARFYRACKKELDASRFFLQDYRTDKHYRWGYAKLRRKNTEYVRVGQEHLKQKTGVFIDIFVVDNIPDGFLKRNLYYALNFCVRKALYAELGMKQSDSVFLRLWYSLIYRSFSKDIFFNIRNRLAFSANKHKTKLKSHYLYPYPSPETKYGMPSECFEEYMDMEFEGKTFRVFKQYNRYLTLLYGDYMTPPPPEKRNFHSEASIIRFLEE